MNLPRVYMYSPSWTPPPPSPSHPSGSSQCTSPEHPVSCIKPGLAIYFTFDNIQNTDILGISKLKWTGMGEFNSVPPGKLKQNTRLLQSHSCFTPVQFSCSVVSNSLWPHESQHARPPCPSPTPRVHSDPHPSSQWCHPAISSSVIPFSSCPLSLPASESFPMNQLFAWGGQSTGVSALASFPPKKSQVWSPSEWTGWISLQSKGLSRVFSNTTVQKNQFFGTQPSSQSNSHVHTWPLEKP